MTSERHCDSEKKEKKMSCARKPHGKMKKEAQEETKMITEVNGTGGERLGQTRLSLLQKRKKNTPIHHLSNSQIV